jgi:hypothetical protein
MPAPKTGEITPEMVEAGAEIIRCDRYDLSADELARKVFEAMVSAQVFRTKPYTVSQRRRARARATANPV